MWFDIHWFNRLFTLTGLTGKRPGALRYGLGNKGRRKRRNVCLAQVIVSD
jgi:hypothetical protein